MTQYYDKAEVDALIPNMTNYYTKTEVDALISTSGGIEVINPVLYAQTYGFYFTDEVKSGDIVVVELRGSNDTVIGSFVISYTNNNINNAIAINPGFSLTPDANNYVESYDIASLRYDSTNESYVVLCMTVTKTITNGLSAISHNTRVLSNTNSKVTIYRKAEE